MSEPLLTITAAAKRLGMSTRRVREICQQGGIGTLVNGRLRVLSVADLASVEAARRPRGNPNWVRRPEKQQLTKKTGRKS